MDELVVAISKVIDAKVAVAIAEHESYKHSGHDKSNLNKAVSEAEAELQEVLFDIW